MAADDGFLDKAVEGLVLFAFNQGEVRTCPSRALVHERIYDRFMERCVRRVEAIKMGDPLDPATMMGAQASHEQYKKILNYIDIGRQEGAEVLTGGGTFDNPSYPDGFYIRPTLLKGHNKMRVFHRRRSSGPSSASPPSRTTRKRWRSPTIRCTDWRRRLDPRRASNALFRPRH